MGRITLGRTLGLFSCLLVLGWAIGCAGGGVGNDPLPGLAKGVLRISGSILSSRDLVTSIRPDILPDSGVSGAEVFLESNPAVRTFSGVNGVFHLSPVSPGSHRVIARVQSTSGAFFKARSAVVTVSEDSPEGKTGTLVLAEADGSMVGILRDASNNPIVNAVVTIWGESVTTNTSGRFTTPPIPSGQLGTVEFQATGFQTTSMEIPFLSSSPVNLETMLPRTGDTNRPPVVTIKPSATRVSPGGSIRLSATAQDPESQQLSLAWETSRGKLTPDSGGLGAYWMAPDQGGPATITFVASDPFGLTSRFSVYITVNGLVSVSPTITGFSPAANAVGVSSDTSPWATFNQAMDPKTLTASNISLTAKGVSIPLLFSIFPNNTTVSFRPASPMAAGTLHTVTISQGVRSAQGTAMEQAVTWNFTTGSLGGDFTPPTISSVHPAENAVGVPTDSGISVTFSEAIDPTSLSTSTFTLMKGSVSLPGTVALSSDGRVATFTPSVSLDPESTFTAAITNGIRDLAQNALVSGKTWSFSTGDFDRPAVSLSTTAPDPTNTAPIPVTVTFTESVTGFTIDDVTVGNGTSGNFQTLQAGVRFSLYVVPGGAGTVTVDIAAGVASDSSGNGNSAAVRLSRLYDPIAPFVVLTTNASEPTRTVPIMVTASFDEPVTGFSIDDVTVTNGTTASFQTIDPNKVFTFGVHPIAVGQVSISVKAGVATDSAGNGNHASVSLTRTYVGERPTVSISSTASESTRVSPIPVTVTFDSMVTGFALEDINVMGGAKTNFQTIVPGRIFCFDVIPMAEGEVRIDVAENSAQSADGKGNIAPPTFTRKYDLTSPTVTSVTSDNADGSYGVGALIDVLVIFSEPVVFTGQPSLKLETGTIDRIALCNSSGGIASLSFRYVVQPGDSCTYLDYTDTGALTGAIGDIAGNVADNTLPEPSSAGSLYWNKSLTIDTAPPEPVALNSLSPADEATDVPLGAILSISFKEKVAIGSSGRVFLRDTLTDAVVEEFPFSSGRLEVSGTMVRILPSNPLTSGTQYYVMIEAGCITDLAGNPFPGISNKTQWNFTAAGEKLITSFDFQGLAPFAIGRIDQATRRISIEVPWGTSLANLVPTIRHTGVSVSPQSGVGQNFTDGVPVPYTVTGADSSTQVYQVTVNVVQDISPDGAFMDVTRGLICQVAVTMEYSLDNEASYSPCPGSVVPVTFVVGNMVWVRMAADHTRRKFLGRVEAVSGRPDLSLATGSRWVSYNRPAGVPGASARLQYLFVNAGDSPNGSFPIRFYISPDRTISAADMLIASESFDINGFGRFPDSGYYQTDFTVPNLPPGEYFIGGIIDPDNAVSELSEENNVTPPDRVVPFVIKDPTAPQEGAFKFVNSWGKGGSWETIPDGHYWVTYKTMKKQEMEVYYFRNSTGQVYQPRVVAVFQLTHPERDDCKVILGLGDPSAPVAFKELQARWGSTLHGGPWPFPSGRMVVDISEFARFINDHDFFLSVVNQQGTDGFVNSLALEFYSDYTLPPFRTISGGTGAFGSNQTTNFTVSTTGTLSAAEVQAILPLARAARREDLWIEEQPSGAELERDMKRLRVFRPGVDYNPIIAGKHGTGMIPPTIDEWGRMKKLRSFSTSTGKDGASLPDSVDHSRSIHFPPIGNQGSKGSCVCFSTAYYVQTYNMARDHNWDLSGTTWVSPDPQGLSERGAPDSNLNRILSPDFVYHQINDGEDEGSRYIDAVTLICRLGCSSWNTMPYDTSDFKLWPKEPAWREAGNYRGKEVEGWDENQMNQYGYFVVRTDADIQLLKSLLNGGYCVTVPIMAGDLYPLRDSNDVIDNDTAPASWDTNHAQTIVGYKEGSAWNKSSPDD